MTEILTRVITLHEAMTYVVNDKRAISGDREGKLIKIC